MARLTLLCGLPGSGKTTLARQIAGETGALIFSPDEWLAVLGHSLWDESDREKVERLQRQVAFDVLDGGCSVVLENGFWSRQERSDLRAEAQRRGHDVELYYLKVALDELEARVTQRGDPAITRSQLEEWSAVFEAPGAEEMPIVMEAGNPADR